MMANDGDDNEEEGSRRMAMELRESKRMKKSVDAENLEVLTCCRL